MSKDLYNKLREILLEEFAFLMGKKVSDIHPDSLVMQCVDETESAITDLMIEIIGEDEDIDDLDEIRNWIYYQAYKSNADDFVRGYNTAKAELRSLIKGSEK